MYDVIVIGCGPAGMTSAIYLARANKKVLVLEKETIGGQMASSPLIENYPGYASISGSELASNMFEQLSDLGVEVELEEVKEIKAGVVKEVITEDNVYEAKSVIISTGSKYRLLNLDNEEELIGKGIHFCVACDGAFYKNKDVVVVGGGNSAIINAITLSDICNKVYVVQNLEYLTAEDILVKKLESKDNAEVILDATITKIVGENELESVIISSNGNEKLLNVDGMFISIGLTPQSDFVKDILDINKFGYIKSNEGVTGVDGIFVAGDCRDKQVRQITVATSDGTVAAMNAINYLENN